MGGGDCLKVFFVKRKGDTSSSILGAHGLKVRTDNRRTAEEDSDVGVNGLLLHGGEDLVPLGPTVPDPNILQVVGRPIAGLHRRGDLL